MPVIDATVSRTQPRPPYSSTLLIFTLVSPGRVSEALSGFVHAGRFT